MVIRELAAQPADAKHRHREEVAELEAALAAGHGELLQLRRRHADDRLDGELHDPDGTMTRVPQLREAVAQTRGVVPGPQM
jgi:hypothetical protein